MFTIIMKEPEHIFLSVWVFQLDLVIELIVCVVINEAFLILFRVRDFHHDEVIEPLLYDCHKESISHFGKRFVLSS